MSEIQWTTPAICPQSNSCWSSRVYGKGANSRQEVETVELLCPSLEQGLAHYTACRSDLIGHLFLHGPCAKGGFYILLKGCQNNNKEYVTETSGGLQKPKIFTLSSF